MKHINRLFSLIFIFFLVSCLPVQAKSYTIDVGSFENEFTPSVTVTIEAVKELDGRDLNDEEFSFTLYDEDGNKIETVKNDEDGNIVFSDIEYTEVGTYEYTIEEIEGSLGGITYDDTVISVVVEVTEDEDEEDLVAEVTYTNDATFSNTYSAESVTITLTAYKVLENKTLESGEFSFNLYNNDGELIATAKNKADGSIALANITYTAAGTYTYVVKEVAGSSSDITYDSNSYTIIVTVEDDLEGQLTASVDNVPTFTNSYKEEETTEETVVVDEDEDADDYRTGDSVPYGVFVGLIIILLAGGILLWIKKSGQ